MFVHHLTEFFVQLQRNTEPDSFDTKYISALNAIISSHDHSIEIDDDIFNEICKLYASRWYEILDTSDDYLINPWIGNNQIWVQLASALAIGRERNALQILIPGAKNKRDLVSLQTLANATALPDMFLSDDGETLQNQRSLLKRVSEKQLSSIKIYNKPPSLAIAESSFKIRPLSLIELLRLSLKIKPTRNKSSNDALPHVIHEKNQSSTGSQHSEADDKSKSGKSFWEILINKIMPGWRGNGELPVQVLSELLHLIELYFIEKDNIVEGYDISLVAKNDLNVPTDPNMIDLHLQAYLTSKVLILSKIKPTVLKLSNRYFVYGKPEYKGGQWKFTELDAHVIHELITEDDIASKELKSSKSSAVCSHIHSKRGHSDFCKQLIDWSRTLLDLSIDDANHLYGQSLDVAGKNYYLLEILISCLKNEGEGLDEKMLSLARWIYQRDASLVASQEQLQSVYAKLKVGRWFNGEVLKEKLALLDDSGDLQLRSSIIKIKELILAKNGIDAQVVDELRKLYKERWSKVQDTEKDYMRTGTNDAWVGLARDLSAAKLISKNYYRFLIPSLTNDNNASTRDSVCCFPLSHYILSDSGKELILLDDCVSHYKQRRTFYNCNTFPAKALSPKELERISFAHPKFGKYKELAQVAYDDDPSLKMSTILAIKALVDGSLHASGLIGLVDYSEEELSTATLAYAAFYEYLNGISEDERNRLYQQNILLYSKWYTVKEILDDVQKGASQVKLQEEQGKKFALGEQEGCVALAGKLFAKLVMDYDPNLKFRRDLELHADTGASIQQMREDSRRKILREQHDTAMIKVQTILFSLLTHDFSKSTEPLVFISLGGYTNKIPEVASAIFSKLKPLLESNDYKKAAIVLSDIVKDSVNPALDVYNKTPWYWLFQQRNPVIQSWLNSLVTNNAQSLYAKNNIYAQLWVLESLLSASDMDIHVNERQFINDAIDDILRDSLTIKNLMHSNIQTNLRLNKLLDEKMLSAQTKNFIFTFLKESKETNFDEVEYKKKWIDKILSRLQCMDERANLFDLSRVNLSVDQKQKVSAKLNGLSRSDTSSSSARNVRFSGDVKDTLSGLFTQLMNGFSSLSFISVTTNSSSSQSMSDILVNSLVM